jgi:ketosteroid isomerase-like protein
MLWGVATAAMLPEMNEPAVDTQSAAAAALPEQGFQPDRFWWERLFAVIDAGDAPSFVAFLTADAQFQFGNMPVVVGSEAIRAAASGFFAAIASSRHRLLRTLNGASAAACEGEVSYTRHDGSTLCVPFANVFAFRADKIAAYRIYIDNSALFAPRA